jgi:cellulose synthase/poly-beta-1,6-N-acetylglucosamine synthase-like glycosyltransferase
VSHIFYILITVLSLYILGVSFYIFVITVAAYFFRKRVSHAGRTLKIAVIIPAHNEEGHIAATVENVKRSRYPKGCYSVFVIADNCTDGTEERAKRAGAKVFKRLDLQKRGKGQALDWFFTHHRTLYRQFDAVVMIDADTIVHKDFLKEISSSLKYPGVKAVQGYYGVSNAGEHWRSGLMSVAFHVFNHLRPSGQNRLGGTAGLRGNGMGFRTDLILSTGWPAHSIVEDYEFSLKLLLKDVVVHYNPDALVFSDMPIEKKTAETQRMRWEGGLDFSARNKFARLVFMKLLKSPRVHYFDTLVGFYIPPLSLLLLGQLLLFAATFLVGSKLALFLAACFLIDAFYVFSGLILRRATPGEWRSLLLAPLYVLWKIPVYFKMRKIDSRVWRRTRRPSEVQKG